MHFSRCKWPILQVLRKKDIPLTSPKSPTNSKTPKTILDAKRDYHISGRYYEEYIKRLNSKNISIQSDAILGNGEYNPYTQERENHSFLNLDGTVVKQKSVNQLLKKASKLAGEIANINQRDTEEEKQLQEFERQMRKKLQDMEDDYREHGYGNGIENGFGNDMETDWKNQKKLTKKNPNYL